MNSGFSNAVNNSMSEHRIMQSPSGAVILILGIDLAAVNK